MNPDLITWGIGLLFLLMWFQSRKIDELERKVWFIERHRTDSQALASDWQKVLGSNPFEDRKH